MVLEKLNIKQYASDYSVCMWEYKGNILILNLSTNDILMATANGEATTYMKEVLAKFFNINKSINPAEFTYLNWHII